MKQTLKDIGTIAFDLILAIIITIIALNVIGATLISTALGAEQPLTKEQEVVAQTILGEARGEGEAGMYAVACVIQKRVINRHMKAHKVCLQEWKGIHQFSCWNDGKESNSLNTKQGIYAKLLATNLHRLQLSYVKDADHYCTLNTHNYWTKKSEPVRIIGNHKFYKLRP